MHCRTAPCADPALSGAPGCTRPGMAEDQALTGKEAMRLAAHKLPIKVKFLSRHEA